MCSRRRRSSARTARGCGRELALAAALISPIALADPGLLDAIHRIRAAGCEDLVDPVNRDVGIARRGQRAWIVLAAPLVPPAASDTEAE